MPETSARKRRLPRGRDGRDGRPGLQGLPGDPNELKPFIEAEIEQKIAALPLPKSGRDGKDGINGKDGRDGESIQGIKGDRGEKGESVQGPKGDRGPKPDHRWIDTALQFEKPNGDWGQLVDLKGDDGRSGETRIISGGGGGGGRGPAGAGVAVGGEPGQILAKASATNYDTEWIDAAGLTAQDVFIQPDQPTAIVSYLWIQTGLGAGEDFSFWFDDSGLTGNNVFIQPDQPTVMIPYLWIETGLGVGGNDFTFAFEDAA